MEVQLVLIGGRSSIPNILTIRDQKPEVILALTSNESTTDFPKFKNLVQKIFPFSTVEELPPVDAFDYEIIEQCCEKAFQRFPDAHWICNITAATTVMSIAVYKQATRFKNACLYLNTARSRVITLVGPKLAVEQEKAIFHLEIEQYVASYYYSLENGDLEERRGYCEQYWLPFAQKLGKNPSLAFHLKSILRAIGNNKPKNDQPKGYSLSSMSQEVRDLLAEAEGIGLVQRLQIFSDTLKVTLTHLQYSFLNGGWLEVYVWDEANKLKLFDDCQWNRKIRIAGVGRELDVAMTYKAQLIIAECKTGDEAYESATIDKFVSVVNPLGERFVGKILITSLPPLEETKSNEASKFAAKAAQHRIVIVTGPQLPELGQILMREAVQPTYPRI